MSSAVLRCLHARATLADPAPEIRRARKQALRGDPDWRRRLTRLEQHDVVIVALSATAIIDHGPDPVEVVPYRHAAVWIDEPIAPVDVSCSLREIAQNDFKPLAAGLRDRGVTLAGGEDDIAIELVIDADLAQQLEQHRRS